MNKLLATLLASTFMLAATIPAAYAVDVNNNFQVSVTLTSQCKAKNSGTTTVDFGNYTAFQASAATGTAVDLTFDCTRGFSPTSVAFDTTNGTAAGVGVLQGLQYTLTAGAASTAAGTAASTSTIGTADVKTYNITGTMPGLQAGACATASCGPTAHTRTLIVTF